MWLSRGKEGTDWYNEKGAGHSSELSWVEENDETLFLGHIKRKCKKRLFWGGIFFFFFLSKLRQGFVNLSLLCVLMCLTVLVCLDFSVFVYERESGCVVDRVYERERENAECSGNESN